jgi:hypothetical protein
MRCWSLASRKNFPCPTEGPQGQCYSWMLGNTSQGPTAGCLLAIERLGARCFFYTDFRAESLLSQWNDVRTMLRQLLLRNTIQLLQINKSAQEESIQRFVLHASPSPANVLF